MTEQEALWEAIKLFVETVSQCTNCEGCKRMAKDALIALGAVSE